MVRKGTDLATNVLLPLVGVGRCHSHRVEIELVVQIFPSGYLPNLTLELPAT